MINGSLQIGQSAIRANQAAIQVIGNNVANATSADYTRQRPVTEPLLYGNSGLGAGVRVAEVRRLADEAINSRLRGAMSEEAAAQAAAELYTQIETILNPLGENNIAAKIETFFDSFSELANDPQSTALRTLVLQAGQALARSLSNASASLEQQRTQIDGQLGTMVEQANDLLAQVARLNEQIVQVECGGLAGNSAPMRDQRDATLAQLAGLMNFTSYSSADGTINVFLGSSPLVFGNTAFSLRFEATEPGMNVFLPDNRNPANIDGGKIGGLLSARTQGIDVVEHSLDELAVAIIGEVNRIHSCGQPVNEVASLVGSERVADSSASLAQAGLTVVPVNGTFTLHVTGPTGLRTENVVEVDLDGVGSDDSLDSLAAKLNSLGYVTAAATADGRLSIATAASGYTISFSADTSGVLAGLGVNTFFTGHNAATMTLRPGLAAGDIAASANHLAGDGSNALELAGLADRQIGSLGNATIGGAFTNMSVVLAARSAEVNGTMESAGAMVDALASQRDAISGVNIDEEALDLMQYQRAYQGAAHYISLINELIGELINLV